MAREDFTPEQHEQARRRWLKRQAKLERKYGPGSLWTAAHQAAFEDGAHYDRETPLPDSVRPPERRSPPPPFVDPPTGIIELVDDREPWRQIELGELDGAPATFARHCSEHGLTIAARAAGPAVQVGVKDPEANRLMARATWVNGRILAASMKGQAIGITALTALIDSTA